MQKTKDWATWTSIPTKNGCVPEELAVPAPLGGLQESVGIIYDDMIAPSIFSNVYKTNKTKHMIKEHWCINICTTNTVKMF